MKRIIIITLVAALTASTVACLSGCGCSDNSSGNSETTTIETTTEAVSTTEAVTETMEIETSAVLSQTEPGGAPVPSSPQYDNNIQDTRETDENGEYYEPLYNTDHDAQGRPVIPYYRDRNDIKSKGN